jgi:glutamate carboxypeptidase
MQVKKSIRSLTILPEHRSALEYLAKQNERIRRLLPAWCAICSGSEHSIGLKQMRATLVDAIMQTLGGFAELHDDGADDGLISIRCRSDAPFRVLFSGHYDTVFGPAHPFQDSRWLDDNTLNAPGCADMKGGLLVMLLTLEAFEHFARKQNLGWEIQITPDEETGSTHSVGAIREAAKRNHLGLVFEPARPDGLLVRNRKGTGKFEACATGRAAHSGENFENGRNAIKALGRFILAIEALNEKYLGAAIINTGWIEGGGALNAVPDQALARFHLRISDPDTYARVTQDIEDLVAAANKSDGIGLTWSGQLDRPPMIKSPVEERCFGLLRECARHFDCELDWRNAGGGSDGNILAAAGLPVLDGLGICGGELHSSNEYAKIDSVCERASIPALFLMHLADLGRLPEASDWAD